MGSNVSETKVVWAGGGALAMVVEVVVFWWWLGSAGGDGAVVDKPKGKGVGCFSVVLIFLETGNNIPSGMVEWPEVLTP